MAIYLPPIPNNPITDVFVWRDWFYKVSQLLGEQAGIAWTSINFTGSNLRDIVTRQHNALQDIQGGIASEYYHLSQAQYNTIASFPTLPISIANGGTGQTTATNAINALLPSQTSNAGKVLSTDGTNTSWITSSSGTVTSVGGTGTVSGISLSGTVTSSGNLTLGGTLDLSSPPTIGNTTPNTGSFTTLIGGANAANYGQLTGGATTKAVEFMALGTDSNISIALDSKGTGAIDLAAGSSGINISNGNTVTAITRTATGSGYTTPPTWTASAPTTAGGVTASGSVNNIILVSATIAGGGTGYTVGNTLTIVGGTSTVAATLTVLTVSAGVITSVTSPQNGLYTVAPTSPVSVTGGSGTGATFNVSFGISTNFTITTAGSGYVEQPTITFSGGGGSGATAYATVGSPTIIRSLGSQILFHTPGGPSLGIADNAGNLTNYAQIFGSAGGSPAIISSAQALVLAGGTNTGVQLYSNRYGSLQLNVAHTASAVNYVQVTGSATGGNPVISVQGSDASRGLVLTSKGQANLLFNSSNNSFTQFLVNGANNSVNYHQVAGSVAGQAPIYSVLGTDTNISMAFQPKGTGAIDLAAGSSGVNISNGGTVTAITRTAAGSAYTSFPSIAITAPTTAGGVQATASVASMGVNAGTVASGGTGYTVGDVLTVVGGTPVGGAATLTVTAVSGGVITSVSSTNFLTYTVLPANPVSVTGGTGSSATLNLTYFVPASFTITAAGSGYIEQPTVTFSGGGGSGAAAFAIVGSQAIIKGIGASSGTTSNQSIMFQTPAGNSFLLRDAGTATPDAHGMLQATANGYAIFMAEGSNANANLYVGAKGTGSVRFNTSGLSLTEQCRIAHTASAVNYVQVTGSTTGSLPTISAQGSDASIGLGYNSKSFTGSHRFYLSNAEALRIEQFGSTAVVNRFSMFANTSGGTPLLSTRGSDTNVGFDFSTQGASNYRFYTNTASNGTGVVQFAVNHTASAVNYLQTTGSIAGASPAFSVAGTDTNIDLVLTPKGTGNVRFGTYTANMAVTVQGYIEIKDSGGTVRRLAVVT